MNAAAITKQGSSSILHIALFAIITCSPVTAALSHTDTEPEIEEVIVTAQKREQRVMDVPMSVSVVTGQVIEQLNISNALGLSYRVPSLVVQEVNPGNQLFTLRGIGNTFGASRLVGVYLDEADVTSASPFGQYDLVMYDLERVEVLRGPQGTLYGAGSVGGTVRLITSKPRLDQLGWKGEMSVFDQARGDAGYEVRAVVNAPIAKDVFALRLAVNYQDWGGWIDQPAAGREDINDNKLRDARLRALWRINDRFDVNGTVIVHRNDGDGLNVANLPPYEDSYLQTFIDPSLETPFADNYEHYNLTISYDFDSATLLSATGFTGTSQHGTGSRRFEFESELIPGFPGSDVFESYASNSVDSSLFTQELRLSSASNSNIDWVAGLYYRDQDERIDEVHTSALGSTVLGQDIPSAWVARNESWSAFANISLALGQRWEAGLGARYFEDERYGGEPVGGTGQHADFDDFSPRAYLSYKASGNANIYASFAQGFRSGGFNGTAVEAAGGQGTYGPEHVDSYELGAKMNLADGHLYTELVLFYSKYLDMQSAGVLPGTLFSVVSNIAEAEIQGFEWTIHWRPTDTLLLGFNGSLIDTEVLAVNASDTPQIPGDPLNQVAETTWSLFADYDFYWGGGRPGYLRLGFDKQGPVRLTDRALGLINPFGVSDTLEFLHGRLGIKRGRSTLELFGRNLLDEHGRSNPNDAGYMETQPRPRMIGVRVMFDFE